MKSLSRCGAAAALLLLCACGSNQEAVQATAVATSQPSSEEVVTDDCDALPHERVVTPHDGNALALALAEAEPGTLIKLAPKAYRGAFVARADGDDEAPIALCGPREAVLTGLGEDTGYGLHLDGARHWLLRGFTVANSKKGIVLDRSDDNVLAQLTLRKLGEQAVIVRNGSEDNVLEDSELSDLGTHNASHGVYVASGDNLFQRNRVLLDGRGYGFFVAAPGNLVRCDNEVRGASSGTVNVVCGKRSEDDTETEVTPPPPVVVPPPADEDEDEEAPPAPTPTGLNGSLAPSRNFDLRKWKLTLPSGQDVQAEQLNRDFTSAREFYTDRETGGMVFRTPNRAGTTKSTKYSRSELREMLVPDGSAKDDANNWTTADGGLLRATLRVDHVSTTGVSEKIGRVVIGQIHGDDSEPVRLYFHKGKGEKRGRIYAGHDTASNASSFSRDIVPNAGDAGIALGEVFSYEIRLEGTRLTVVVQPASGPAVTYVKDIDPAYRGENLYFKAGVYNQNDGGEEVDFVQATFFALTHSH